MTFQEVMELPIGTKLKLLDAWPKDAMWPNSAGEMDHWLGQIVTLRGVSDGWTSFHIEEDIDENGGGWYWDAEIIEYVVDEGEEFEIAPEVIFGSLFEVG